MSFVQRAFRTVFLAVMFLAFVQAPALAEWAPVTEPPNNGIKPGTIITMQNWQQYEQFMTPAMQALFAGKYFWKFPPDFQLAIEATKNYPLGSRQYIEDTEKHSGQVRIVNLPDGGHNVANYEAGLPFPNPSAPLKGWKLLVDGWFAYQPYLLCTTKGVGYYQDRFYNVTSTYIKYAQFRAAHVSAPGQPIYNPQLPQTDFVEYWEVTAPEQARYTGILTSYPRDLTKDEQTYVFVPSLRRTLRLATTARCSPVLGSDFTYDDSRHGAFNGNITKFDAKYLGDHKVLEAPDVPSYDATNIDPYLYKPSFFAKPSFVKWQVRDAYVIDVRRIPALQEGYCYGKRILYMDKQVMQAVWAELYDANMKLWKIDYDPQGIVQEPNVGPVWTNFGWGTIYDIQNDHLSEANFPLVADQQCKNANGSGVDMTNVKRYFQSSGLSMIMR